MILAQTDFIVKAKLDDHFYNKIGIKKDSLFCVGCKTPAPINVSVTISKDCNIVVNPKLVVASYQEVISNDVFDVTVVAYKFNGLGLTNIKFVVYDAPQPAADSTMLVTKPSWGRPRGVSDFVTVCGNCTTVLQDATEEHLKAMCRVSRVDLSFALEPTIEIRDCTIESEVKSHTSKIFRYDSVIFPV